jgi:hypothetical protein
MLYEPRLIVNVRNNIETGIVSALFAAAVDFIAGTNKPWTYYLGVGLGQMALATGIPGATATLYVVGDTVDAVLFKSPDGSDVRVFLNGIAHSTLDTYAAAAVWEAFNINGLVGGQVNRLDLVNVGPSPNPNATGIAWFGLGPITVNGSNAYAKGAIQPMNTLAIRIKDAEADSNLATLPIYLPDGLTLAQVQAYADAILPEIDALTDGTIEEVSVTFQLTLPGGLAATPAVGALNERGGLISFETTGPRRDSVRIPAMSRDLMPGDSFAITATQVAAFITRLTTATTAANIRPVTAQNYQFTNAISGKKSFRK